MSSLPKIEPKMVTVLNQASLLYTAASILEGNCRRRGVKIGERQKNQINRLLGMAELLVASVAEGFTDPDDQATRQEPAEAECQTV